MIEERTYYPEDLHHGVCIHCEMESDEITADGRCIDCVEDELFFEQTMKGGWR